MNIKPFTCRTFIEIACGKDGWDICNRPPRCSAAKYGKTRGWDKRTSERLALAASKRESIYIAFSLRPISQGIIPLMIHYYIYTIDGINPRYREKLAHALVRHYRYHPHEDFLAATEMDFKRIRGIGAGSIPYCIELQAIIKKNLGSNTTFA